jgi:chromosome segregation ATPase
MASDMKKLDSLGKQIDQYESHLKMVQNDIASISSKRDKAQAELVDVQAKAKDAVAQAAQECEDFKGVMKAMQADIDAQKQKLAEDRQRLNQDRSGLVGQQDTFEMRRRDLENDKRKVSAFIQSISPIVSAWK